MIEFVLTHLMYVQPPHPEGPGMPALVCFVVSIELDLCPTQWDPRVLVDCLVLDESPVQE